MNKAGRSTKSSEALVKILRRKAQELNRKSIMRGERYCYESDMVTGAADKIEKLEAENLELETILDENTFLKGRIEELEAGYAECIEEVEHWGAYASGYFQQKHDLEGEVERHKSILKGEG